MAGTGIIDSTDAAAQAQADQYGVPVYSQESNSYIYPSTSSTADLSAVATSPTGAVTAAPATTAAAAPTTGAGDAARRRRWEQAVFFDVDPGARQLDEYGMAPTVSSPWWQGAGYYDQSVLTPTVFHGAWGPEYTYDPNAYLGAEMPEEFRSGTIGGLATRYAPAGEGGWMGTGQERGAYLSGLQSLLNERGEDLWSFGNIYAQAARDTGHGIGNLGLTPEQIAYLDETYGGEALFGLTPEYENPYLQMTVRGDLPDHSLARGGYMTTAEGLYDYFSQIPGALEDPTVIAALQGALAGQQEAAPHEQAFRESREKRKGYGRMAASLLATLPLGAALGSAMAAANTAAAGGVQTGLTAAQKAGLAAAGSMAKSGLQGAEIGDILKAGAMGGLGAVGTGMLGGLGGGGAGGDLSFESMYDVAPGSGDIGYAADWMPDDSFTRVGGMSFAPGMQPFDFRTAAGLETFRGAPGVNMTPVPGTEGASAFDILRGVTPTVPTDFTPGAYDDVTPADLDRMPAERGMLDNISPQKALGYAQQAYKLYGLVRQLLGGDEADASLPERREGQSDADYWQDIAVNYLGLDTKTMAEAGLEPGTPEYMEYILQQADSIIAQIFGADPSALEGAETVEDLQAALRGKSRQEMQQLARALAVRGQLGQTSFAERAVDPFTGMVEEFGGSLGGQGDIAAYQRGLARSTENLAGLRGSEARGMLGGLLGRNADIFGLRAARDAQMLREMLAARSQDDEKRKRGTDLYGSDYTGEAWFDEVEALDDKALQQLLGRLGNDPERLQEALAMLTRA